MSHDLPGEADLDRRLNEIVLQFLEADQVGQPIDRRRLVEEHPELRAELEEFFAGHDEAALLGQATRAVDAGLAGDPGAEAGEIGLLGDYRLLREVGRGGMGVVYEAEQISLRRRVALKVLPFASALDSRQLQRFKNEALAAAQLRHPNIVPVYAVGEERGVHYYAMQFIDGQTLASAIADLRQPASPAASTVAGPASSTTPSAGSATYYRRAAALGVQAALALEHAHQMGVLHRDVKPANLLLDGQGNLWVTDFGLAQVSGDGDLTRTGELLGTLRYASPEQALARRGLVGPRSDVYSLGATLYELLTLRPLFDGRDRKELLRQIADEEPRPPRAVTPFVPVELETIVLKALDKESANRYASAQELADDLQRFLDNRPIRARRPTLAERLRKWVRRHPAAVLTGVVVLFVGLVASVATTALVRVAQQKTEAAYQSERRQALILQAQKIRLTSRMLGWSSEAWERVRAAARIEVDEDLKREAAATLGGLDARTVQEFEHGASAVAFNPSGKRLLMGGLAGQQTARLWDRVTGKVVASRQAGAGPVTFAGDGTALQLVRQADDPACLVLWDLDRQKQVQTFRLPGKTPAPAAEHDYLHLAVTPGATAVAAAFALPGVKGAVAVWDSSGKLVEMIPRRASAVALAPDGALLAAGSEEGSIEVWSVGGDGPAVVLPAGRMAVRSLTFGRDPLRRESDEQDNVEGEWILASGHAGGDVKVWDVQARSVRAHCHGSPWDVHALAISPDGTTLASAGRSNGRLWDLATGRVLLHLPFPDFATGLAFSADGLKLAVCSNHLVRPDQSRVVVFELDHGRGLRTLRGLTGQVAQVQVSPDGKQVAALTQNWQVALWNVESGQLLHVLEVPKGVFADNAALRFSADGGLFAFATGTRAKLWETASGKELDSWALPMGLVDRLAFDAAGRLLLFRVETRDEKPPYGRGPEDWRKHPRVCRIRHLRQGEDARELARIDVFNRHVQTAGLSPDGRHLVVQGIGGADGQQHSLRVFAVATGEELARLPLSALDARGWVILDPPGKVLAFAPRTNTPIRLLNVPSLEPAGRLEATPLAIGPGAEVWGGFLEEHRFALVRRQDGAVLSTFPADALATSNVFDAGGDRWIWSHNDGRVTVCDIGKVRQRLSGIGLGW
jgi:WD40 repeat protein